VRPPRSRSRSDDGQASVELVALLPLLGVLAALLWQALLAGEALWLRGTAARAAARAAAVGEDPARAARGVLPARFEAGLRVARAADGSVVVAVPVPLALGDGRLALVRATAGFEAQR